MKGQILLLLGIVTLPLFAAPVFAAQLIPAEAIEKNDVQAVSKAIGEGADVNAFYAAADTSPTALMKAADTDSADVAKLLLDKKADVNLCSKSGSTALMHAARQNSAKVAALLIERDADLEASDKAGLTACSSCRDSGSSWALAVETANKVAAQKRAARMRLRILTAEREPSPARSMVEYAASVE